MQAITPKVIIKSVIVGFPAASGLILPFLLMDEKQPRVLTSIFLGGIGIMLGLGIDRIINQKK